MLFSELEYKRVDMEALKNNCIKDLYNKFISGVVLLVSKLILLLVFVLYQLLTRRTSKVELHKAEQDNSIHIPGACSGGEQGEGRGNDYCRVCLQLQQGYFCSTGEGY